MTSGQLEDGVHEDDTDIEESEHKIENSEPVSIHITTIYHTYYLIAHTSANMLASYIYFERWQKADPNLAKPTCNHDFSTNLLPKGLSESYH
jgi:hypothetical protein